MICCKCGQDKPREEFYAGRTECKPCKKAIAAENKRLRKLRDPSYREYVRIKHREWKAKNPEKVRARKKAWKKTEAGRIYSRLRERSRRLLARTGSNKATRAVSAHCAALLTLQKWRCAVCRADLRDGKHLDHVIPLAAGGRHEVGNFQWLCPPCNGAKSAKHPVDFMQSRGFLL